MRTAKQIADAFEKQRRESTGLGLLEQSLQVNVFVLEVLLDIRDLLVDVREQRKEVVVDFVPPDYGKKSKL